MRLNEEFDPIIQMLLLAGILFFASFTTIGVIFSHHPWRVDMTGAVTAPVLERVYWEAFMSLITLGIYIFNVGLNFEVNNYLYSLCFVEITVTVFHHPHRM